VVHLACIRDTKYEYKIICGKTWSQKTFLKAQVVWQDEIKIDLKAVKLARLVVIRNTKSIHL
jgi:hypothetical protein